MKNFPSLIFILALSTNLFGQTAGNNSYKLILDIEKQIVEQDFDQTGIELINEYDTSVKSLNQFRLGVISSYDDQSLTQRDKNKKFRSENYNSDIFIELKENIELARISKTEYLSANYPEYAKLSSMASGQSRILNRGHKSNRFKLKGVSVRDLKSKG